MIQVALRRNALARRSLYPWPIERDRRAVTFEGLEAGGAALVQTFHTTHIHHGIATFSHRRQLQANAGEAEFSTELYLRAWPLPRSRGDATPPDTTLDH
jgi:hypothetical protein